MAEPWQCPACKTWLAPHVSEHRCEPPEGAVGAKPAPPRPLTPVTTASNVTMTFSGAPIIAGQLRRETLAYQRRNPNLTLRIA